MEWVDGLVLGSFFFIHRILVLAAQVLLMFFGRYSDSLYTMNSFVLILFFFFSFFLSQLFFCALGRVHFLLISFLSPHFIFPISPSFPSVCVNKFSYPLPFPFLFSFVSSNSSATHWSCFPGPHSAIVPHSYSLNGYFTPFLPLGFWVFSVFPSTASSRSVSMVGPELVMYKTLPCTIGLAVKWAYIYSSLVDRGGETVFYLLH